MRKHEIQKKLEEIIDFSGVERYIDTPVKRYSSGMYVRLAFAVAAHLESEILIVDEVLAVGDAEFQKKCLGKMGEVSKGEGRTILFVSHNMAAIENLCKKSILINKGKLIQYDTTDVVIDNYLKDTVLNTDINNIKNRKGVGKIILTKITQFNKYMEIVDFLQSGKFFTIRLNYECLENIKHQNCRISLAIKKDSNPLIVLSSELTQKKSITLNGKGYIDFSIDNFPLSEGSYDITLFLETRDNIQDWFTINNFLNVVDGDFYDTGINSPLGWKGKTVLVNHSIEIK
jgi:lipopolysaccharide transport system ATP-binding protein